MHSVLLLLSKPIFLQLTDILRARVHCGFHFDRFHRGDVLITTATGVMTEEEGEKWGLVPTHAYAVLDIREYKVSLGACFLSYQLFHLVILSVLAHLKDCAATSLFNTCVSSIKSMLSFDINYFSFRPH